MSQSQAKEKLPASGIVLVTGSYWAFMLTDGALRMLLLLHFHNLGFSAVSLAYLFLVYEIMGVVTNVVAGWLGTRRGIYTLLFSGLSLQTGALVALALFNPVSASVLSIAVVMVLQGLSGIAKDLVKTGAKSAMKLLAGEGKQSALFKSVAMLTGSKNAIKGLGFFVGAALLATLGFEGGLLLLALLLVVIIGTLLFSSRPIIGTTNSSLKLREVLSPNASVNKLSAARLFLFGARDTWFVVALPVFLHTALSLHTQLNAGQAQFATGGFLALWVVAYGGIQAMAPKLFNNTQGAVEQSVKDLHRWTAMVAVVLTLLSLVAGLSTQNALFSGSLSLIGILLLGLLIFGAVFALCSALHSYLILAFTNTANVTSDVGFYYMANAAGRLLGTLLSGLSYQLGGITCSLIAATLMAIISYFLSKRLQVQAT